MSFSPFARYRNFTVENLKALLEVYPDMQRQMSWSEAGDIIESNLHGYKRTAYQQACQLGLEDKSSEHFRVQSYLFSFGDENLEKYLKFWIKTYYAPNPYVQSRDDAFIIYCELAKEILGSKKLEIDYHDFFERRIGGKSEDILMNAIRAFCSPIRFKKDPDSEKNIFYVDAKNTQLLSDEVHSIETNFPINDQSSKADFFDRYSYNKFCEFYGITPELEEVDDNNTNTNCKRITGGTNILLYGVPGAGKSYTIQHEYCSDPRYIERVVFHPDYSNSDFVGQILPRVEDGGLKYVFSPGPFTKLLKRAYDDPGSMYYLIIEELNRGNAPAIFGEVFQLMDRKEDDIYPDNVIGESVYSISNYDIASIVYEDSEKLVKLPSNLTILATMNTSDQNVFTLDTAFQRRWIMRHVENDILSAKHAKVCIEGSRIDWGTFATVINEEILNANDGLASSEDKRLGAYFATLKELSADRFPEKVLKYLWDDAFKMDREVVFADGLNSLDIVIESFEGSQDDKLKAVLRANIYVKMLKEMNIVSGVDGAEREYDGI